MTTKILISKDVVQKFKPFIELSELPDELLISTMTITGSFETTFNIENIGKYLDLNQNGIVTVKYGNDDNSIRTLLVKKRRNKKKTKKTGSFYNQVTLVVKSGKFNPVNIKIFKNGAIQLTGCKSIEHIFSSLNVVCDELKKIKGLYNPTTVKIERKPFVTNITKINVEDVKNLRIRMINSNFKLGFKIDRDVLFKIINDMNVQCIYEPCVHACVNIKYNYKDTDQISIFVFESGSIIITGAKSKDHIYKAYEFITKIIYDKYNLVCKNDAESFLERPEIKQLIEQCNYIDSLRFDMNDQQVFDRIKLAI